MASDALSAVRSVGRALAVLSLFTFEHQTRSLREICTETGLPRTTALRLLDALETTGMISGLGGQEYAVGPGLLRWGTLASARFHLPAAAQSALSELVETTRETASIYVRSGYGRICIAQQESTQALRHVALVGRERPLWVGAAGRILLSDLDDRELDDVLAHAAADGAPATLARQWRADILETGHAVTHNEREDGLSVVAVPIRTETGAVSAALSTAGPTARFGPDRIPALLGALQTARDAIETTPFPRSVRAGRV
jgi:DNA-binding IclR family transcriptional regulator